MPVRQFDGVDDAIRCAIGAANLAGAFTVAVLVRKTRDSTTETFLCSHTASGTPVVLLGSSRSNYPYYEVNGVSGLGTAQFSASEGWHVLAMTKAAGTVNVRLHLRALGGTAWSHQASRTATNANPNSTLNGSWRFANRATRYGAARLALAGVWDRAMSDSEVEALTAGLRSADWLGHPGGAPRALWELDGASVDTPIEDATGGGAGQVAIAGTAAVTGDDPPGWTFLGTAEPPPAGEARKSIYALTAAEWDRFVQALQALKSSGVYDAFTRRHVQAMMQRTLLPGETGTSRNIAHRGPSFGPWHRRSLRELELELQRVDASVTLPYWDWGAERSTWTTARIWQLIGGNGDGSRGWRITTGPFAGWTSIIWNSRTGSFESRTGIIRQFSTSSLPDPSSAQSPTTYDVEPWREDSDPSRSFRRRIEDHHNVVHLRIGGDMNTGTAPNDPVFWLHHANIDRLWAQWQARHGVRNYQPTGEGPTGHNVDDVMGFLASTSTRPADVLDVAALGYSYEEVAA